MTDERVTAHHIRVGPVGWSYKDWASQVYPKSQPHGFNSLAYLAQYLDAVETDSAYMGAHRARQAAGRNGVRRHKVEIGEGKFMERRRPTPTTFDGLANAYLKYARENKRSWGSGWHVPQETF